MFKQKALNLIKLGNQIRCQHSASKMNDVVNDIKTLFRGAYTAVSPQNLISRNVKLYNDILTVREKDYDLSKGCYLVGFGKAVLGMSVELERILVAKIIEGIVCVPEGIFETFKNQPDLLPDSSSKLRFLEGAKNNLPDEAAVKNAKQVMDFIANLPYDSLLFVLISGGGSALLPLPKPPITCREKMDLIKSLSFAGADIHELNTVRKQISEVKGGGLARHAHPTRIISLILSDVVGDNLDIIASGPTTVNTDDLSKAQEILLKYKLAHKLPCSIKKVLYPTRIESQEKCLYIIDDKFMHVDNYLIGANFIALDAVYKLAQSLNYTPCILSSEIEGSVEIVSSLYTDLVQIVTRNCRKDTTEAAFALQLKHIKEYWNISPCTVQKLYNTIQHFRSQRFSGICLIAGGEPTVKVTGNGVGGRNQELALRMSNLMSSAEFLSDTMTFLSGGTDGIDGPTDAAGAIGMANIVQQATKNDISVINYLNNNDSYTFYSLFERGKYLLRTGHTGTNVMDVHIIIIKP